MKNKQETQNKTNVLDFWKKYTLNSNIIKLCWMKTLHSFRLTYTLTVAQQWCNFEYIDHLLIKFVIANKLFVINKEKDKKIM